MKPTTDTRAAQHTPSAEVIVATAYYRQRDEIAALQSENARLHGALDGLLRLADRAGLCPIGETRSEIEAARAAIARATQ